MSNGKYEFKVNGDEFTTEKADPTAMEILDIAKSGGAISDNPDVYILRGDKGDYRGNDRVDLAEDNVFVTVPAGPTPVASLGYLKMSDDASKVQAELATLGYCTSLRSWNGHTVVEFDYCVEVGSRKGEKVKIGLSFKTLGYPEYPPHWIHVSPPVDDGLGGSTQAYQTDDGQEWIAMSRPPKELWDRLPVKNMKAYLSEHMRRFWNCI